MVSPAFLASKYIWENEIPLILKHHKAGMLVFPLITKPCAWRIDTDLAKLQARPTNDHALSLGTDGEVDSDLADFVYELAGLLGQVPSSVASDEVDRVRSQNVRQGSNPVRPLRATNPAFGGEEWLKAGKAWIGVYRPTNRRMRLVIRALEAQRVIVGTVEYPDEGTITQIEGNILDKSDIDGDPILVHAIEPRSTIDGAIVFREVGEVNRGSKPVDRNGEYRAIVVGTSMLGFWIPNGGTPKQFEFKCET